MLDASAAVEWLLQTPAGERVGHRVRESATKTHAPHLLDIEVTQALRRMLQLRHISLMETTEALRDLQSIPVQRYPHQLLLQRIWELRNSFTAYDAAYVALAEALGATLITCDSRLGAAHGHDATILVI